MERYHLFLFLGQSNMAGRGAVCSAFPEKAPSLAENTAFEYRAVSAPGVLSPLCEPFGAQEDDPNGINDHGKKSGSLVSAFAQAYCEATAEKLIGISASVGGTSIERWLPGTAYFDDIIKRLESFRAFSEKAGIDAARKSVVFCQGETDGDSYMPPALWQAHFFTLWMALQRLGFETCYLIPIGKCNAPGRETHYDALIAAQKALSLPHVVVTDAGFDTMRERGLMKDWFHYYQQGYNEAGAKAGKLTAQHVLRK